LGLRSRAGQGGLRARGGPRLEVLEDRTVPSISLPTPGTPGPVTLTGTTGADSFVIRVQYQTSGPDTRVEFSENGGVSFSSAARSDVTSIAVNGLAGQDALAIDISNGLVASSSGLPITFTGGSGSDTVALAGLAGFTVTDSYTAGVHRGAGTVLVSNGSLVQNLTFSGVEKVQDTITSDTFTANLGNRRNLVSLLDGPQVTEIGKSSTDKRVTTDRIQIADRLGLNLAPGQNQSGDSRDDNGGTSDRLEDSQLALFGASTIDFANKTKAVINGQGGADIFTVNFATAADKLTNLTIDGAGGNNTLLRVQAPSTLTLTLQNIQQQPTGSGNLFIEDLYATRLGRAASDSDLSFWTPILNGSGRSAVVQGIEKSAEAAELKVVTWYERYLGRTPTDGSESYWVNLLTSGQTDEQVLAGILSSDEFLQRATQTASGTSVSAQLTQALYNNLLNRDAGSSDLNFWTQFLGSNPTQQTRQAAVLGFLNSQEFHTDAVRELYSTLLHRDLDDAGFRFWVGQPFKLGQILSGILQSGEFAGS